jgi:hypothetical protein
MTLEYQDIGSGKDLTAPEVDFALVLSRVIGSIKDDPAQLRNAVYEFARIKLQREARQRNPPMSLLETQLLVLTLEVAIERVEIVSSKQDELKALQSLERLIESSQISARETLIEPRKPPRIINQASAQTAGAGHLSVYFAPAKQVPPTVAPPRHWPGAAPLLRGALIAIFGVVLWVALDRQFGPFGRQAPQSAAPMVQKDKSPEPKPVVQAPRSVSQSPATTLQTESSPFPLPSVYGVYAVSGGELHELEALVIRVPDQRILMSTPIKTPSRTVLPDGRIMFIVFRRDVASSAPERVTVRAIAKVMRAMTFTTAGQASTAKVEDSWTIRNVSYDFRVAPSSESSEMLLIRPENVDFVFPAGRYGLAFKGQAYDFTVAGPITEAAQCLERTEAANGAFYSECRRP